MDASTEAADFCSTGIPDPDDRQREAAAERVRQGCCALSCTAGSSDEIPAPDKGSGTTGIAASLRRSAGSSDTPGGPAGPVA